MEKLVCWLTGSFFLPHGVRSLVFSPHHSVHHLVFFLSSFDPFVYRLIHSIVHLVWLILFWEWVSYLDDLSSWILSWCNSLLALLYSLQLLNLITQSYVLWYLSLSLSGFSLPSSWSLVLQEDRHLDDVSPGRHHPNWKQRQMRRRRQHFLSRWEKRQQDWNRKRWKLTATANGIKEQESERKWEKRVRFKAWQRLKWFLDTRHDHHHHQKYVMQTRSAGKNRRESTPVSQSLYSRTLFWFNSGSSLSECSIRKSKMNQNRNYDHHPHHHLLKREQQALNERKE